MEPHDSVLGWFDWPELYARMVLAVPDDSCAHFVECGTYCGKSAAYMGSMLRAHPKKRILFETWDDWSGVPGRLSGEELAAAAWDNLARYRNVVVQRVGECISAASEYADGSLGFVFLDDDHSEEHVLAELRAWWPKVSDGGTLAGHDRNMASVAAALDRWSHESGVAVLPEGSECWRADKAIRKSHPHFPML